MIQMNAAAKSTTTTTIKQQRLLKRRERRKKKFIKFKKIEKSPNENRVIGIKAHNVEIIVEIVRVELSSAE